MRGRGSSLNYRDLMVLKGGGRGHPVPSSGGSPKRRLVPSPRIHGIGPAI